MSANDTDFPEIAIYPAPWKTLANVLGSTMFAVASVFFIVTDDLGARLLGTAGFFAFTASAAYAAHRLLARSPVVTLNADGLWDNASPFAVGWIAWSEIERIERRRSYLVRLIGIVPRNRDAVFARVPPARRWLVALHAAFAYAPVNIPAGFLGRRFDEVDDLIHRYHARFGPGT